jgi:hypothetical protein
MKLKIRLKNFLMISLLKSQMLSKNKPQVRPLKLFYQLNLLRKSEKLLKKSLKLLLLQ